MQARAIPAAWPPDKLPCAAMMGHCAQLHVQHIRSSCRIAAKPTRPTPTPLHSMGATRLQPLLAMALHQPTMMRLAMGSLATRAARLRRACSSAAARARRTRTSKAGSSCTAGCAPATSMPPVCLHALLVPRRPSACARHTAGGSHASCKLAVLPGTRLSYCLPPRLAPMACWRPGLKSWRLQRTWCQRCWRQQRCW